MGDVICMHGPSDWDEKSAETAFREVAKGQGIRVTSKLMERWKARHICKTCGAWGNGFGVRPDERGALVVLRDDEEKQ